VTVGGIPSMVTLAVPAPLRAASTHRSFVFPARLMTCEVASDECSARCADVDERRCERTIALIADQSLQRNVPERPAPRVIRVRPRSSTRVVTAENASIRAP
jgi:hypothetical protein